MRTLLLNRDSFRNGVFKRDNHLCVICKEPAVDAHHIIDRKLFDDGGYYLDNGASLCSKDHIRAEKCELTCEEIRASAGITTIILPEGFDPDLIYDKWGKLVLNKHVKYPRTPHLPWSEKCTDDDKKLVDVDHFNGREIVATIKMDGENTTMYNDKIHARSLNSDNHPSRDWVKGLWSRISYEISPDWRICGENLYALHTIPYNNLKSYFNVFSIWDKERCLSWSETLEICMLLELETVPVFYRGVFDRARIERLFPATYNGDPTEGYVIRLADDYTYHNFNRSIAKFVSKTFVIKNDKHWSQGKIIPNKINDETL